MVTEGTSPSTPTGPPGPSDSPAKLRLRKARSDDLEFVKALSGQVFAIYGSYDEYLVDWFRSPGVRTMVAERSEEPMGFFMLTAYPGARNPVEGVADLLAIAVRPEFQAQGIGTFLLEQSVHQAVRFPFPVPLTELHLSVADGNSKAQRLFGKFGFRLQQDQGIYPAGQRALHMVRVLDSTGSTDHA